MLRSAWVVREGAGSSPALGISWVVCLVLMGGRSSGSLWLGFGRDHPCSGPDFGVGADCGGREPIWPSSGISVCQPPCAGLKSKTESAQAPEP